MHRYFLGGVTALVLAICVGVVSADDALEWLTDYHEAVATAKEREKMLVVWFVDPRSAANVEHFQQATLNHPDVAGSLKKMVAVKVSTDTRITSDGKEFVLLQHPAFAEMLNTQGIAIIDHAHPKASYYGRVVSVYPFRRTWISQPHLKALLDLPPGTLTQRTVIWAVRTHREAPASAWGNVNDALLTEAESHSQHQANIRLQGHHQWESRFHRVNSQIGGLVSQEVCAESWPGQSLIEAAEDCVHCWRQSPGHWSAVRTQPVYYGYDMKLGSNQIWYATGIFGRYR